MRVVAVSGQAFLDEDGSLSQFVGVLSDITETSRQRVAAEDRALFAEQMVGIVSHDLRNPLAAIMTGTQVLALGNDLPEFKAKALVRVVNSSELGQAPDRRTSGLLRLHVLGGDFRCRRGPSICTR